jgi:hypothetical protein
MQKIISEYNRLRDIYDPSTPIFEGTPAAYDRLRSWQARADAALREMERKWEEQRRAEEAREERRRREEEEASRSQYYSGREWRRPPEDQSGE